MERFFYSESKTALTIGKVQYLQAFSPTSDAVVIYRLNEVCEHYETIEDLHGLLGLLKHLAIFPPNPFVGVPAP